MSLEEDMKLYTRKGSDEMDAHQHGHLVGGAREGVAREGHDLRDSLQQAC
jgi:hypothetical protein